MKKLATIIAMVVALYCAATAQATIIWQPSYWLSDPIEAGWGYVEAPYDTAGVTHPEQLRIEGHNLRAELKPGDRYTSPNGYTVPRAEVRQHVQYKSVPATDTRWNYCENCIRWTREHIYVPPDFTLTTDGLKWLVATQFKGLVGGSPPEAIEIKKSYWQFVHQGVRYNIWPVQRGGNITIAVGMFLSPDPTKGWFEVWATPQDGIRRLVVPRTYGSTMDRYWKTDHWVTDQVYLKNGIYQSGRWDESWFKHVLYIGAPLITDTRPF